MEIILREKDIKEIVKKYYSGVTDVKFSSKNPKITLVMDNIEPIEPKPVTKHNTEVKVVESPPRQEPPKNVMTSERRIVEL